MKKLISICLTICMLLSMVSFTNVFAATPAFAGSYNSADAAYKNGYTSTVGNIKAAIRNGDAAVAGVDYQASSSAPWGGNGYFVMVHGDWAYFDVDMPYTGVYVMQMKTDWANSFPITYQVTTEEGYAAEFHITQGSWSSGCNQDQLIYLKEGKNTIKVQLVGDNNAILSCIDFGALNASGAEKSLDYLPLVKLASDLEDPSLRPTPTPEPTPTPKVYFPEGWDGVVENHPDVNFDEDALTIEGYMLNMSSDEGTELFGTDWGMVGETGSFPSKGQNNGVYLPAGSSATYTLNNIATSGVYAAQVKVGTAGGATTLQMINNVDGVNYYAEYNVKNLNSWAATWSNNASLNIDDFLYLQAGSNEITIYNAGPNGIVYFENDFGGLNNNDSYMQYVGTDDDTTSIWPDGWTGNVRDCGDWTGAYTSGTDGYNVGSEFDELFLNIPYTENGFDLSNDIWAAYTITAPASGMYLVEAVAEGDGTLTLTTQDLDYVTFDLDELDPQYIYLSEGDNIITATGSNGTDFISATFYQLNNSNDYLSQRENVNDLPEEAYDISIIPSKDIVGTTGSGYFVWGYDNGQAIVQYAGSSVQYEVEVFFPGIYRVEANIGGTISSPYPLCTVDVNETYRAQLATAYADDWGSWRNKDADGAYQYVYLAEGTNFVEVFTAHTHQVLHEVRFVQLTEEEAASITMEDLKLAPPKPLSIRPARDAITDVRNVDYFLTRTDLTGPSLNNNENYLTAELVPGEWMRFELNAKVEGYYQVATTAAVYNGEVDINVKTDRSIATVHHVTSPDNYRTFSGDCVYLNEGVNNVWVQNEGSGFFYLKEVSFTYVEDTEETSARTFVPAHDFIGAPENIGDIERYTVRNNHFGIHVGDTDDAAANTETKQYNVSILKDDYYGLLMSCTMPLTGKVTITLNNGTDDIVLYDDVAPYFGNENTYNTITLTADKVYLPAGDYTMTFTFTENNEVGSGNSLLLTHVHGFEFTTLTRQDLLLAAMQSAEDTDDIKAALEEYADVLADDIGADLENDFIYPEYAYNALLNCAMLETGAYETYEDVKTAYDFAKNMISVADDGTGSLVYTVQVGDWNEIGTTVLVAVYAGDQLYMMGEGYLEYEESMGTYVPVEATLYDYVPEDGDVIKVFVWDSIDGLKPVF